MTLWLKGLLLLSFCCWWGTANAESNVIHHDPIAPVLLGVTGILFVAVLGRFMARRWGQPSVLGELMMGIALGNLGYYLGFDFIQMLREGPVVFDMVDKVMAGTPLHQSAYETFSTPELAEQMLRILSGEGGAALMQVAHTVDVFSRYGVIFLLFLVGLDTSTSELTSVGRESMKVAVLGVALPFVFGFTAARLLMPELSLNVDLFVAAALGATSIGITARVLQDLNCTNLHESRVILGAAVIDDVLGLVMLAIVTGIIVSGGLDLWDMLSTVLLAALFLVTAFMVGPRFLQWIINLVTRLDIVEAKLFIAFLFVMVLAWFANAVGLATIVGAFAAGVILQDGYFKHWGASENHRVSIRDLIMPLEVILVPIFFVLMGVQVKIESFLNTHILMMALGLLAAAIAGKLLCGLASRKGGRLLVGVGMLPRGEVGLIFASIGKSLDVISDELFSAVVLMVIVTTLLAPAWMKYLLNRRLQQS